MDVSSVYAEYKNAIVALSDRLGEDKWFLGSRFVCISNVSRYDLIQSTARQQH